MLEVINLTKKFGEITAVSGVSFKVKQGEIFSLIGPNGSGKTTIIKIIAGLLRPTAGEAIVDGRSIEKEPKKVKEVIGYIPDEPYVWGAMTGREFLHLSGALYGIAKDERTKKIEKLLDIFDLSGIEDGYFEDYSRGNKQKFTILAALLHRPKLLLIDEPIVGLDPQSAHKAKEEFREFAKQGGAILLATHTLSVAQEISHRIGVLKEGRLIHQGTYSELCKITNLKEGVSLEKIYQKLTS